MSLAYKVIIFCQKHLKQSFCYTVAHSQPFNEMFIFSGQFKFLYNGSTNVLFTSLLTKNVLKRRIIFDV